MAESHNINQYWLVICEIYGVSYQWHSSKKTLVVSRKIHLNITINLGNLGTIRQRSHTLCYMIPEWNFQPTPQPIPPTDSGLHIRPLTTIMLSIDMMTSSNGNIFRTAGLLRGEFTGSCEFPQKASDAELWCFRWSAPEQTVEKTIEPPVIWEPSRSLWCQSNEETANWMYFYLPLNIP